MENTGKLLFDESPLLIQKKLAMKLDVDGAIFIQQLHYLIHNKQLGSDFSTFKDGFIWIYNTWWGWQEFFPFWNEKKIKRLIKSLEDKKILIGRTDLNQFMYDKTKWYRIDYDVLLSLPEKDYFSGEGKKFKEKKIERIIKNQNEKKIAKGQNVPMSNSNGLEVGSTIKTPSIPCSSTKGQNVPMEKDKMSLPIPKNSITKISSLKDLVCMYVPVDLSPIDLFKEVIKSNPTKYVEIELQNIEKIYGKDLINEAIKRLAEKDTTKYIAFLKGVLDRWIKKGAITLEDVKRIEDEHKQKLQQKQKKQRTRRNKPIRTELVPDWLPTQNGQAKDVTNASTKTTASKEDIEAERKRLEEELQIFKKKDKAI